MYGLSGFGENLNFTNTLNEKNCVNLMWNLYEIVYGLSRFAENFNSVNTLNVENCKNSMGICVH